MDANGPVPPLSGQTGPDEALDQNTYEVVASFRSYAEAQRAVDHLSDSNFDVRSITIVARGITFVERVTGRLGWGRALLSGAGTGALIGAFLGFIFGIFNFFAPLQSALALALYGLLFGAILGGLLAVIGYAFTGGERDFTSVGGFRAESYDVTAHPNVAEDARRLLQQLP